MCCHHVALQWIGKFDELNAFLNWRPLDTAVLHYYLAVVVVQQ